jgi:DNA-binding MarR family transcriptional regulator
MPTDPVEPELAAWSLVLDTYVTLMPRFEELLEREAGLSLAWFDVLINLMLEPEHQTRMSVLAERCTLSLSRLSRVVPEIEEAGYVERRPDPDDGRAVLVRLTDTGRQLTQRAFDLHLKDVKQRFARHLTKGQAHAIIEGLSAVLQAQGREPSPIGLWVPE